MSGGLVSFGDYTFSNLQDYDDNFSDAHARSTSFTGVDGVWDVEGFGAGAAPGGRVDQNFDLWAEDREDMDDLRDAVRALQFVGLKRLIYQPTDSADSQRWTWARVASVTIRQDKARHTDLHQPVRIIFDCPTPIWWVNAYTGWLIGDGSKIGAVGLKIGGGGYEIAASGTSTTDSVTNNGNVADTPEIIIQPGAGNSCENPVIQRLDGTLVVDEVRYTGTVGATDILSINGRNQEIQLNGADVWANVEVLHPSLFRLVPGANSIRILFENVGDAADVIFYYRHSYR